MSKLLTLLLSTATLLSLSTALSAAPSQEKNQAHGFDWHANGKLALGEPLEDEEDKYQRVNSVLKDHDTTWVCSFAGSGQASRCTEG